MISSSSGFRPTDSAVSLARQIKSSGSSRAGKNPSPIRPARRAAARECPPTTMGTVPFAGWGKQWTLLKEKKSPLNDAFCCAQSALITATYSSVRTPRSSKEAPITSNSSRIQPTPIPSKTRPPLIRSSVATCFAATTGLCCGRMRTPVPSLIRVV